MAGMTKPHYHPFKLQQDVLDNLDAVVAWLEAHPQYRPVRRGRAGVSRAAGGLWPAGDGGECRDFARWLKDRVHERAE